MDIIKRFYSVKQKCVEVANGALKRNNAVSAYMFHRVTDINYKTYKNLTISVSDFQSFILGKLKDGYKFIGLKELENKENFNGKTAIITFDDMYMDAYLNAIPFLNKHSLPFVVFITADFINKEEYIDSDALNFLKNNELCTIGGHTISHKPLKLLNKNQKEYEISKKEISEKLGITVEYFAYPYGTYYACDKKARLIAAKNYKFAFSTLNYPFTYKQLKKKPYFIPRININSFNYLYDGNVIKSFRRRK